MIDNKDDAMDKINALTKGLDKDSIECVYRIISRSYKTDLEYNGNLTEEENKELAKITYEFYPKISMLTQNCYHWQGYFLPINNFEVSVFWHQHSMHTFSKQTLEKIKNADIIDVGGYIGDSAIVLRKFTNHKIHTFEPTSKNFELLKQTLKLNESSQIVPNKFALGKKRENIQISVRVSVRGIYSSIIYNISRKYEEIEVNTLDLVCKRKQCKSWFYKSRYRRCRNGLFRRCIRNDKITKTSHAFKYISLR